MCTYRKKEKTSGASVMLQRYLSSQYSMEERLVMGKAPEDVDMASSRAQAAVKEYERCFNGYDNNTNEEQNPSNKA